MPREEGSSSRKGVEALREEEHYVWVIEASFIGFQQRTFLF